MSDADVIWCSLCLERRAIIFEAEIGDLPAEDYCEVCLRGMAEAGYDVPRTEPTR